jgi:hypothetical protein
MAESVKTPLRMTAREFVTCLALKLKGTNPSAWSAPPHRRVGKLTPRGTNCSFFDGWRARRLQRFCWGSAPMSWRDCVYNELFTHSSALTLREASYPPVSIFHARTWTPRCSSGRPTPLTALKERVPAAQVISLYVPGRSGSIGPRIVARRDRAPREDCSP